MRYKLGNWQILVDDLVVTMGEQKIHIEPKIMDLLVCFINNQGQVLSKDYLIEQVWGGLVVSDHAVTSCVAKLRKVLANDSLIPTYIETISKRGYKLAASIPIEHLSATTSKTSSNILQQDISVKKISLIAGASIVILVGGYVYSFHIRGDNIKHSQTIPSNTQELTAKPNAKPLFFQGMQPITSLDGAENIPSISPDEKYLSYLHYNKHTKQWDIHINEYKTGQSVHIIKDVSKYTVPAWSYNSKQLVFHRIGAKQCDIYLANVEQGNIDETKIHSCKLYSVAIDFAWDKKSELIYFNERPDKTEAAVVYQLNLLTGRKVQLTNPTNNGFGDYRLRYSFEQEELFFLRNDNWTSKHTSFYTIRPTTKELTLLFTKNRFIKYMTLTTSSYPVFATDGYTLNYYDLKQQKEYLAYKSHLPLKYPFVSKNDNKLLFVSDVFRGRNLFVHSLTGQVSETLLTTLHSTRNEDAPMFANNSSLLAFVSNRTGVRQIYIVNMQGEIISKTNFNKDMHITKLVWSKDDKTIYAHVKQELYVIDVASGEYTSSALNVPLVNFNEQFSEESYYASNHHLDWQIYKYDGNNATQITEKGGYYSALSKDGQSLYFSKYRVKGLWITDLQTGKESELIPDLDLLSTKGFYLIGHFIYYRIKTDSGFELLKYNINSKQSKSIAKITGSIKRTYSVSFDGQYIVYSEQDENRQSDIVMAERVDGL